jgi:hypothetical protein
LNAFFGALSPSSDEVPLRRFPNAENRFFAAFVVIDAISTSFDPSDENTFSTPDFCGLLLPVPDDDAGLGAEDGRGGGTA